MSADAGKPPYRVPSMAEIIAVPWNGLKIADLFSGTGGTCLGFRMAGFKVAYANEFVPIAQESYRLNMSPDTVLDCRDVRDVRAVEILEKIKMKPGELDVLTGSPPCMAFSSAGRRAKGWGQDKAYENGAKQKNEEMFFEYVRILGGLMPRAFMAENVSGLVKGVAKGYFLDILAQLKGCGYRVEAQLLDAQWLGVPQQRSRIIFIGVRDDLAAKPAFPKPLSYRYSVREAIPWLDGMTVGDPAIPQRAGNSFPRGEAWDIDKPCPVIHASGNAIGGAPTHEVQARVTDDERVEVRMVVGNDAFEPKFGGIDQPSPTLMAGGARTSGLVEAARGSAVERRKFTIAELRRLGGFPDDFQLAGSFAQQWARIGNSVPPPMAFHIARIIRDEMLLKHGDAIKGQKRSKAFLGANKARAK